MTNDQRPALKTWAGMLVLAISAFAVVSASNAPTNRTVRIGSKVFTESVILGEIAVGLLKSKGIDARHDRELGGTRILWDALLQGNIDLYVEYTGTITEEILAGQRFADLEAVRVELDRRGVVMSAPLGFNNTYALGMRRDTAERLGIRTISDLRKHPDLVFGFSNEFLDRGDGWRKLREFYGLPQTDVRGMQHDLAYRALEAKSIDAVALYSTDAEIDYYKLVTLGDDRRFFPRYEAVVLYRKDLASTGIGDLLKSVEGAIDEARIIRLNARVKIEKATESQAASEFLATLNIASPVERDTRAQRFVRHTVEHLQLTVVSLGAALVVAVPLGIVAARFRRFGQIVLSATGIVQTVPSLALLVFMIPFLGIGAPPAVAALFLYGLLPIVRNTHAGLVSIPPHLVESAVALGLPAGARLRLVELPLASRAILAGIKTSAVINIGTATLGALIGAGGYGQPILTGIRLNDTGLILEGAIPAAAMALLAQGAFDLLEILIVPKGLRSGSDAG